MSSPVRDRRVRIIKALAHPTRLRIAELLGEGERCVSELQQLVGGDISTVSRHLSQMCEAGWIDRRKGGLQVFYRLSCPCLPAFLSCIEDIGSRAPDCDC